MKERILLASPRKLELTLNVKDILARFESVMLLDLDTSRIKLSGRNSIDWNYAVSDKYLTEIKEHMEFTQSSLRAMISDEEYRIFLVNE